MRNFVPEGVFESDKGNWALGHASGEFPSRERITGYETEKWLGTIAGIAALGVGLTGCGGGTSSPAGSTTTSESGQVFVSGTDAPLPSVVSFEVDITGMTVSDGTNAPMSVLNGTQTVDFARLDGLHTLLDLNTIPAGSYRA